MSKAKDVSEWTPKFVQIAPVYIHSPDYSGIEIYALDEDGGVWCLSPEKYARWGQLTSERGKGAK